MPNQTLARSNSSLLPAGDPYRTCALQEYEPTVKCSQRALTVCEVCGARGKLMTAEQAATLCRISRRRIYGWIEAGALHFEELADGAVLVCSRSLLDRVELLECATSRLPMAPVLEAGEASLED